MEPEPSLSLAELLEIDPIEWQDIDQATARSDVGQFGRLRNVDQYIPKMQPARDEDLVKLEEKGFIFDKQMSQEIGRGGYGTVYTCLWRNPNRPEEEKRLVVKKNEINAPNRKKYTVEEFEQQMKKEIRVSELIRENPHQNIVRHELMFGVKIGQIQYPNPIIYLTFMERCSGTLSNFCTDPQFGGGLSVPDPKAKKYIGNPTYKTTPERIIKIWLKHVSQGLAYLHQNKRNENKVSKWITIIHHDLKHDNILYELDPRNDDKTRVKFLLGDFGISEIVDYVEEPGEVWMSNQVRSNRWVSPDVHKIISELASVGKKFQDAEQEGKAFDAKKCDVYALGLMMSDGLVGMTKPAAGRDKYYLANIWKKNHLLTRDKRAYLNQFQVSKELIELMFRLTETEPGDRPSASAILDDDWLKDSTIDGEYVKYSKTK